MAGTQAIISKDELIAQISSTIGKIKVLELTHILKSQHFALRDLIDITFYAEKDIAFRASWLLENLFLQSPLTYEGDLEYLLSRVKAVAHPSCKRHYAKIVMHVTSPKGPAALKARLQNIDLEPVIEQCFDWMIDPKIKIAVKVFAGEALFNMRHKHPWLAEELANQLQFLMRDGSAAIQSRGRKLLDTLKNNPVK